MELRHLEMFVVVAETLHFGRAAARLGCAQPALSRAIRRLESDLEVQLLERDTRNVRLTSAGSSFYAGAVDLVTRAREMERAARTARGLEFERLVLGVGLCGQHPAVGSLIRAFRASRPGTPVKLVAVSEPDIPNVLADGSVHALVAVDWALPAGCSHEPLFESRLSVLLPEAHPLAERAAIEPKDLDGVDLVLPCRSQHPMIAERFRELCEEHDFSPGTSLEVETLDQMLGLVSGGAAAAVLPLPEGFGFPGSVTRPLTLSYPLSYVLGWRRSAPLAAVLQELARSHRSR